MQEKNVQTKKILFTGGGSAGHITPNIPLIEEFKRLGWETHCIVQGNDFEDALLKPTRVILHTISSGKLRRYFSIQNFFDVFKTLIGIVQAMRLMNTIKPNAVFSKGGYIAVPVALAAKAYGVPFFIHESDTTPSLTTKITAPFSELIFSGFPELQVPQPKLFGKVTPTMYAGIPLRREFTVEEKVEFTHKPRMSILVFGGSLGAMTINDTLRRALPVLTEKYDIVHICGKGKADPSIAPTSAYRQYEFVSEGFESLVRAADIVVARGSATSLYELLSLKKPVLMIPLSRKVSRGDQIANADFIMKQGYGDVISDDELEPDILVAKIDAMARNIDSYRKALSDLHLPHATTVIVNEILRRTEATPNDSSTH